MLVAIGCSMGGVAVYHLILHAFAKSMLFMAVGSLIHSAGDEQDLRRLSGLRILPLARLAIVVGVASLMGFPGLSGFRSKEAVVLGVALEGRAVAGLQAEGYYWEGLVALVVLLGGLYSVALLRPLLMASYWLSRERMRDSGSWQEAQWLYYGYSGFIVLVAVSGWLLGDLFIGLGSCWMGLFWAEARGLLSVAEWVAIDWR